MLLETVFDLHYKDKAVTSVDTVEKAREWLKEDAAHYMANTVEGTGEVEDRAKRQSRASKKEFYL